MLTTGQIIEPFLPFAYIVFGLLVLSMMWFYGKRLIKMYVKNRKLNLQNEWMDERHELDRLKGLSPKEFEEYIGNIYSKLGYSTSIVGGRNDGGVDVIAKKNGQKLLIQCKRYKSSTVSVHDVRDFYGAMANNLTDGKGVFITTNIFSSEAEKFAEGKPIELLDGSRLLKLIRMTGNNPEVSKE